jgi:hypothetical protein
MPMRSIWVNNNLPTDVLEPSTESTVINTLHHMHSPSQSSPCTTVLIPSWFRLHLRTHTPSAHRGLLEHGKTALASTSGLTFSSKMLWSRIRDLSSTQHPMCVADTKLEWRKNAAHSRKIGMLHTKLERHTPSQNWNATHPHEIGMAHTLERMSTPLQDWNATHPRTIEML